MPFFLKCPLPSLLVTSLCAALIPSAGAATGDTRVARWKDDKTACFLLMFDDSCPSHFQVAIPEMVKREMIGTFYINPGGNSYSSNSNQWTNVIPQQGMVYGNHTWSHANTTTLAAMEDEIRKCWETIRSIHYPGDPNPHLISYGQPGVTTWYSYGQPLTDILAKYNLISRPPFIAAQAPFTGINTLPELLAVADTAISKKAMGYTIFHGLQRRPSEGDPDLGGQDFWAFDKEVYRRFLDGLKVRRDSGDLWITDHISYHKYETERNSATVTVSTATDSLVKLTLSTTTSSLYDHPLTLRTEVPAGWKAAVISQGASTVSVPVINGTILYDALPNAGAVSITESPLPVVTVKATASEAYETNAGPGVFTISTTGTQPLSINYTITGTAANGTRYTIPAGPLSLAAPSSTINVTPVPNAVYEGEQSVVITIAPGAGYIAGLARSATVVIHDRTDLPPSDWFLRSSQTSSQHWNTLSTWWSQPVGGVQLTAFNRGTVNDRFHTNGFELRTKNAYYPPDQSFYGNNIVLDGPSARLSLALTAYYGSAGMPTNTIPTLTSLAGSIIPFSSTLTQLLTVGTFNSLGTTKISNGGSAAYPTCGLNLRVSRLIGNGDLILTNSLGTSGTMGSTLLNIANATQHRGRIHLVAGTLSFPSNFTSSGPLAVSTGSAVTNNKIVKVPRLIIGSTVMPSGTYTSDQLNGRGATFTGSGTITTSLLPDGWSNLDIGSPALTGTATYAGATWTVTGGGTQLGSTLDKFNFTSAQTAGSNPSIVARVATLQPTPATAQAGVMLRDGTDANAPFVALTVSAAGTITLRARAIAGNAVTTVQAPATVAPPIRFRLIQTNGTVTGAYSTDNVSWIQVGTPVTALAGSPQAGLAICAGTDSVNALATFTDVVMETQPPVMSAHSVSTEVTPSGAGFVIGNGIYEDGTAVNVTTAPASGFIFVRWSENGGSVGEASTLGFTVNKSRELVAEFQAASFAAFKSSYFTADELGNDMVGGISADPDRDGCSNLMEYALATNPKEANVLVHRATLIDGNIVFTFTRSKTAADLTYIVEVSSDLRTWSSSPSDVSAATVVGDNGFTQTLQVKDMRPALTPSRFIRLRVVMQ